MCTCVNNMGSWLWWSLIFLTPACVPLCHKLPRSGSYLSQSDPHHLYPSPSTASDPPGNKQNNRSDLSKSQLTVQRSFPSGMTGICFSLFTSQSDVEKSVLTLKVGYRNITGVALKAVRGKKQINTFHIPLWWSAIDQGLRITTLLHNQHALLCKTCHFNDRKTLHMSDKSAVVSIRYSESSLLPSWPLLRRFPASSSQELMDQISGSIHRIRDYREAIRTKVTEMEASFGVHVSLQDRVTLKRRFDSSRAS